VIPDHRSSARRLFVVSERLPRADESAGSRRLLAILTLLAAEADVALWVERDETTGRGALSAERVALARARLAAAGVRVLPAGWRSFTEALAGPAYAVALFEFHAMAARYAAFVRERQPSARVIVDSVDLHWARLASGAALGAESARRARRMRRVELATYRDADAVLVASTDDGLALSREAGMPAVSCVPIVAPIRPRAPMPRGRELSFVGHFDHAPNVDGLRWFVHAIWPRVLARHPGAHLSVAGTRVSDEVRGLASRPGVRLLGHVPDTAPLLDRAWLSIAPLRYGAGMKGKVVEAMASAVPVVTTPVGAQGLPAVSGEHLLVSEDPSSFADAAASLLDDPERSARIGLAGQRLVAAICAPEVVAPRLRRLIDEVTAAPPDAARAARTSGVAAWLRRWRSSGRHAAVTELRRQARWLARRA